MVKGPLLLLALSREESSSVKLSHPANGVAVLSYNRCPGCPRDATKLFFCPVHLQFGQLQMIKESRKKKHEDEKNYSIDPQIRINKEILSGTHRFRDVFVGFEGLSAVQRIFGKQLEKELGQLMVEVFPKEGFMGVSDEDGHIFASQQYVNNGDFWSVYLDIIHELVHVRQFREGKNLFDPKYSYVDRPTEIEAYKVAVEEARKIGLSEVEIFGYLEVPWITREEQERLARTTGVKLEEQSFSRKSTEKV